jgi:hypothetical protein
MTQKLSAFPCAAQKFFWTAFLLTSIQNRIAAENVDAPPLGRLICFERLRAFNFSGGATPSKARENSFPSACLLKRRCFPKHY